MPNDDLGTFPMPQQASDASSEPNTPSSSAPISQPPVEPTSPPAPAEEPAAPAQPQPQFEETPETIPSYNPEPAPTAAAPTDFQEQAEKLVEANETLIDAQQPVETPITEVPTPEPQPVAPPAPPAPPTPQAAEAPKKKSSAPIVIILVLLLVAGLGLAYAAYLSQQATNLKTQLEDITQTIEKQETALTPTPSATIIETPTVTLAATPSATPSAVPTISVINTMRPLANAASALKVAIKHSPNAQLILIKVDNVESSPSAITKYFFREDLTTKKYFYVAIASTGEPQLIDKQIYVTPDDNIPSLNDAILTNKMGLDLNQALAITISQCSKSNPCITSPIKAQYIKTSTGLLWQVSVYTSGLSSNPLVLQLNAENGSILYKAPGFATL